MFSDKALKKLIEIEFKPIRTDWFSTMLYWIIDSNYGTMKKVDEFLKDQLRFPDPDLVELAESLKARTPEGTVARIESYVYQNFNYKTDKENFGKLEYWAEAKEVLKNKMDDCESLNGLIYILCRLAGIPKEFIWCALGKTKAGYHAWTLFYYPRQDKLCRLDVTINPQIVSMKDKDRFELDDMYESVDYIFNEDVVLK